jgi:predicted O-linked N-acetylglucosamine transferase (SPINDLY family)
MGTPLVSIRSDWMGGRMSSAMLKAIGREDWIAETVEEFADKVHALATRTEDFVSLKNGVRNSFLASELFDGEGLARAFKNTFIDMVRQKQLFSPSKTTNGPSQEAI